MHGLTRSMLGRTVVGATVLVAIAGLVAWAGQILQAAEPAAAEPAPPAGQTYIGATKCASCHFQEFMSWKKTKHATAFALLTAKYEKDPNCLKCHATGYGEASGFKDKATTPALAGNTCENCHGPGSKHAEVCEGYANKKLGAEEEKIANDSIWLVLPKNVCVACHVVTGHKPSPTPPELLKSK